MIILTRHPAIRNSATATTKYVGAVEEKISEAYDTAKLVFKMPKMAAAMSFETINLLPDEALFLEGLIFDLNNN
jgi:hypothetical protein